MHILLHSNIVFCRCECFGHASSFSYIEGNSTHIGRCICDCHPSTNTEGETVRTFWWAKMYLFSNVMSLEKMICFICVIYIQFFLKKLSYGRTSTVIVWNEALFLFNTTWHEILFSMVSDHCKQYAKFVGKLFQNCFRCNFSITYVAIFFHVSEIVASPYTITNHLEEVIVMTRTPVSSASVIIMPTVVFIIKLWTPALTHVPRGEEVCV